MFFRKILRKIKLKVYDQKNIFLDTSKKYSLILSLLALISITINFGFNEVILSHLTNTLILTSSIFYALIYIFKSILNVNVISFLKKNILYSLIIFFIALDILNNFFNYQIVNYIGYKNLIFLLINLYFFFTTLSYVLRNSSYIRNNQKISPTKLLVLSFALLTNIRHL